MLTPPKIIKDIAIVLRFPTLPTLCGLFRAPIFAPALHDQPALPVHSLTAIVCNLRDEELSLAVDSHRKRFSYGSCILVFAPEP